MAVGIHVVRLRFAAVDALGNVINDRTAPLSSKLITSSEFRVIPDTNVPNSAGSPTIKSYLEAEAGDNYVLNHMDQTTIVTYEQV